METRSAVKRETVFGNVIESVWSLDWEESSKYLSDEETGVTVCIKCCGQAARFPQAARCQHNCFQCYVELGGFNSFHNFVVALEQVRDQRLSLLPLDPKRI